MKIEFANEFAQIKCDFYSIFFCCCCDAGGAPIPVNEVVCLFITGAAVVAFTSCPVVHKLPPELGIL